MVAQDGQTLTMEPLNNLLQTETKINNNNKVLASFSLATKFCMFLKLEVF
jgi:hypothetical protein